MSHVLSRQERLSDLIASRRTLLEALTVFPVAVSVACSSRAPVPLLRGGEDGPIMLRRTAEGRRLSRSRYHNAEGFFGGVRQTVGAPICGDELYLTGIVMQLALSAHLLDVGFDDRWCARSIGLQVSRSLDFANATGLDFKSTQVTLLGAILSPYSRWRHSGPSDIPSDLPFTRCEIRDSVRRLLDRVREVTGHPRPRCCRSDQGRA